MPVPLDGQRLLRSVATRLPHPETLVIGMLSARDAGKLKGHTCKHDRRELLRMADCTACGACGLALRRGDTARCTLPNRLWRRCVSRRCQSSSLGSANASRGGAGMRLVRRDLGLVTWLYLACSRRTYVFEFRNVHQRHSHLSALESMWCLLFPKITSALWGEDLICDLI